MPVAAMDRTRTHNAVVRQVQDFMGAHGAWTFKVAGGPMQRPGIPDLLCCLKGMLVAIEIKTGVAVRTDRQAEEHGWLERAGAISILANDVNHVEDRLVAEGLVTPSLQRKRA